LTVIRPHVSGAVYGLSASLNRLLWYPETFGGSGWAHYTPTVWTDGVDSLSASGTIGWWWGQFKARIASRVSVPSPVEIDIDMFYGAKNDTGTAVVTVVATDPIVYSNLRLTMCVIQNGLPPGGQVVRSWEPLWSGLSFSIAEGDTFTHSEEFVIQSAWVEENCRFVAFVQDLSTLDVLQSAQSPVLLPTPAKVNDLTIDLVEDEIWLEWPAVSLDTGGNPLVVDGYNVYRDTVGFRDPGSDPFFFTTDTYFVDDSGVVGTLDRQYFYWVAAVAGSKESIASPGAGEFDRLVETGK